MNTKAQAPNNLGWDRFIFITMSSSITGSLNRLNLRRITKSCFHSLAHFNGELKFFPILFK